MKLFWKIYLAVLIPALVIVSFYTYMIATYELSNEREHAIKANMLASRLITGQIEKEYVESRWPFDSLKKLSQDDDFLFWWIVTDDGTIHLANDTSFIGTHAYTYFPQIKPIKGSEKSILDKKRNCGVFVKLFGKGEQRSFWLGFSLKRLAELQSKIIQMSALLLVLTVGTLGVVVYFTVKHFTRPIKSLTEGAMIVGKGNLNHRVQVQSKDELGYLAHAFNKMAEDLQATTTSIDNLNREITRRKKVEETLRVSRDELRKQNEFLNNVLESLTHPFYVIDANDYTIKMANSAARFGSLRKDSTCYALTHKRDKPCTGEHICPLRQAKKTKKPITVEHIHYDKDGNARNTEVHAYPILDSEGNVLQIIESCYDITERKKAEQVLEKLNKNLESTNQELGRSNKELQDFAYIVSHDMKAPLRGIKTLADWISTDYGDKFDEQGKEQIDLLSSRVDRMHNLIDGILQYSIIGRVKEKMVQVNLNELLPNIIDMVAPPESITISIENELPIIICERTRITQVFENLLSNAVKYMDKPQGQIRIACVEENGFQKFSVADNGPGIEEKYFEKIFQMFQTLSPRDEFESTGIGLTVVNKIVEVYGGRIWVESKLGEGSTFYFTLPQQVMGVKNEKLEANIVS